MGGASAYIDHADAIGTTTMVTDPSGAVVWDITRYPWGQTWQQSGTRPSGVFADLDWQVNDPLQPSATREYNNSLFRWNTPDPDNAGADVGDSQSWDMYSYVGDNPTTNTDPDGLACVEGANGNWYDDNSGGETCAEAFSDKPESVTVTGKASSLSYLTGAIYDFEAFQFHVVEGLLNLPIQSAQMGYTGFTNLFLNNNPRGVVPLALGIAGLSAGGEGEEIEAIANSVAGGHALGEHIGEMVELGVSNKEGLKALVQETIETAGPADVRELERGRVAYYNEGKNVVVIYDPNHIDKGTVFRPRNGRSYFEGLH
jgi:filamentous hemagglutinin